MYRTTVCYADGDIVTRTFDTEKEAFSDLQRAEDLDYRTIAWGVVTDLDRLGPAAMVAMWKLTDSGLIQMYTNHAL